MNGPLPETAPKVAFFFTCSVNYNAPEVGIAAAQVLALNRVRVTVPPQRCCGLSFLDIGDLSRGLQNIQDYIRDLASVVKAGQDVVVSPS